MICRAIHVLLGALFGALHRPLQHDNNQNLPIHEGKDEATQTQEVECLEKKPTEEYTEENKCLNSDMKYKMFYYGSVVVVDNDMNDKRGHHKQLGICDEESKTPPVFDFSLLKNPVFFVYGLSTFLMIIGMAGYGVLNPSRAMSYGATAQQATLLPQVGNNPIYTPYNKKYSFSHSNNAVFD